MKDPDTTGIAPTPPTVSKPSPTPKRAKFEVRLDRHEAKYIISPRLVPLIREYIRPFCERDPYGRGPLPEYVITTLQLDSPDLVLHRAKEMDEPSRFKLRVRTYGEPGQNPVFLEIKRNIKRTIVKSRARIPFEAWGRDLIWNERLSLRFKSRGEELDFLDFVRLVRQLGAGPICLIRYVRESYFGVHDPYARVTFDRRLQYQSTDSWTSWGRGGTWQTMDTGVVQAKGNTFSGVVLEIKTLSDAPQWMMNLVMQFNLERTGNCKYSTAIWKESLFEGRDDAPFAADILRM